MWILPFIFLEGILTLTLIFDQLFKWKEPEFQSDLEQQGKIKLMDKKNCCMWPLWKF